MTLEERMSLLTFPATQQFDPRTLNPTNSVTAKRLNHLRRNAPEMFKGGERFLDVGASKGFMSFIMAKIFKEIYAYEPSSEYVEIIKAVRELRNANNVHVVQGGMRDIPINKEHPLDPLQVDTLTYDTVFVGNCHHYMVESAVEHGAPPFLWVTKLAALCDKTLVIDGPVDMGDSAVQKIADKQKWSATMRGNYIPSTLTRLARQAGFHLVREVANEGGVRKTLVFLRKSRGLACLPLEDSLSELLTRRGIPIACNRNRPTGSVYKVGHVRYKLDPWPLTVPVYEVLNALPEHFPKTQAVLVKNGRIVGDIANWINGPEKPSNKIMFSRFLELNCALYEVGLFDADFRFDDFKRKNNQGPLLKVDVDAVQSAENFVIENLLRWCKWMDNADEVGGLVARFRTAKPGESISCNPFSDMLKFYQKIGGQNGQGKMSSTG